jgi:hypothetical protein
MSGRSFYRLRLQKIELDGYLERLVVYNNVITAKCDAMILFRIMVIERRLYQQPYLPGESVVVYGIGCPIMFGTRAALR